MGEPVDHPWWQYCRRERSLTLFAGVLRPSEHWVVDEHRLDGVATLPGTGILEMIHGAFRHLHGADTPVAIRDVVFLRFVKVPEAGLEVWLSLQEHDGETRFELSSCAAGPGGHRLEDMTLHTTGALAPLLDPPPTTTVPSGDWRQEEPLASIIEFGPHWKRSVLSKIPDDESVVRVSLGEDDRSEVGMYALHPVLLDRALNRFLSERHDGKGVPSAIGELRVYRPLPATVTTVARDVPHRDGAVSMLFCDDQGQVVAECDDLMQVVPVQGQGMTVTEEPRERRLNIRDVGDLNTVELVPFDPDPPRSGEVQIEVYAAGLNFRNVLSAVGGMAGGETGAALAGSECSGRVVAVGPDVDGFSVGEAVMAMGGGAFATRFNAYAMLVAPKPNAVTFEEAAGAPITYLTAMYALTHVGRLTQGERVLIHSAAGGVGLAAVQVATAVGADIYATAGSDEKRAYLRDLGLTHVMDSRSLEFVETIRTQTDGTGVDVVLNSLAGEFIQAGLDVLRPHGRFLEIGKRDIYNNTAIGLRPFRNNLSLHAIDLSTMIRDRHPTLVQLFGDLVDALGQRRLKPGPILPVPWEEAQRAMEHMAAARHIGKVVLVMRKPADRITEGTALRLGGGADDSAPIRTGSVSGAPPADRSPAARDCVGASARGRRG